MMRYTLVPRELHRYEILERKSKFPARVGDSYFVPIFEELWDELENSLDLYFCLDPVRRFNEIKESFLPSEEVYHFEKWTKILPLPILIKKSLLKFPGIGHYQS